MLQPRQPERSLPLRPNLQVYTTAELDASLSAKADKEESYTIADLDQLLAAKADKRNTYRAIEVDDLVTKKADKSDTYNRHEINSRVDFLTLNKADQVDVAEAMRVVKAASVDTRNAFATVDRHLAVKADVSAVYPASEIDAFLAGKADVGAVYPRAEVD